MISGSSAYSKTSLNIRKFIKKRDTQAHTYTHKTKQMKKFLRNIQLYVATYKYQKLNQEKQSGCQKRNENIQKVLHMTSTIITSPPTDGHE